MSCLRRLGILVKLEGSWETTYCLIEGRGAAYQSKICVGPKEAWAYRRLGGGRQGDGTQADSLGQAATDEECAN